MKGQPHSLLRVSKPIFKFKSVQVPTQIAMPYITRPGKEKLTNSSIKTKNIVVQMQNLLLLVDMGNAHYAEVAGGSGVC